MASEVPFLLRVPEDEEITNCAASKQAQASDIETRTSNVLGSQDAAVLLPGACFSSISGRFKNSVIELRADQCPPRVFSDGWGHGISLVKIPEHDLSWLLQKDEKEKRIIMQELADSILNVGTTNADVHIGPSLEVDGEHDSSPWTEGFDTSSCCVGLYKCESTDVPSLSSPGTTNVLANSMNGTQRPTRNYYIVCKAGAGVAGEELSVLLDEKMDAGKTTDEIFKETEVMMRRVNEAGRRNRSRLILKAAQSLGCAASLDTIPDMAASLEGSAPALVLPLIDVGCTSVRQADVKEGETPLWLYYSGAIDATRVQGIVSCNNPASGFIMLKDSNSLYNDYHNALPFSTRILRRQQDIIAHQLTERADKANLPTHPDDAWLRDHFHWKRCPLSVLAQHNGIENERLLDIVNALPTQLWGTHAHASWQFTSASALKVSPSTVSYLTPVSVVLAGTDVRILRGLL